MGPKPEAPTLIAINEAYLERRAAACDQYSLVGLEDIDGPADDEEVFAEYYIERSECEVATFRISPEEVRKLQDAIAAMTREYDRLWAHDAYVMQRYYELFDVLEQVRDMAR